MHLNRLFIIVVIHETDGITTKSDTKELKQILKNIEMEDAYIEVLKLCPLVLIILLQVHR